MDIHIPASSILKSQGITIKTYVRGRKDQTPVSYLSISGIYHQIEYKGYKLIFDLNCTVKWILGPDWAWPDPQTRIRRNLSNEWIIYSSHGYEDTFALTGTYYLPIRQNIKQWDTDNTPFQEAWFKQGLQIQEEVKTICQNIANCCEDKNIASILRTISQQDRKTLDGRYRRLQNIISGTVPILPPDTLLADYDVIPLLISEGCLYNCKFCCLKTGIDWQQRDIKDVTTQINSVKDLLGEDIINYNSVFLGQNDAFACDADFLLESAELALDRLDLKNSFPLGSKLFLFASPTSMIKATDKTFQKLSRLGYDSIFINCGIESTDQNTLDLLGRPTSMEEVKYAIDKAIEINSQPGPLEISLNFLIGEQLPPSHMESLSSVLQSPDRKLPKGTIYISPLIGSAQELRHIKRQILSLKARARWNVKLYLMQGI